MFLFAPLRYDQQGQDKEALMAYRHTEGTGRGFTDAQIRKLCTLSHTALMQGDIFGRFLRNADSCLQGFFGPRSEIREKASENWIKHFQEHAEAYEALGQNDPYFWAKILLIIDRGMQSYFHSCMTATSIADVDNSSLNNFKTIQQQIVFRTFSCSDLPPAIATMVVMNRYAQCPPPPSVFPPVCPPSTVLSTSPSATTSATASRCTKR
jgi:hypothetical protein